MEMLKVDVQKKFGELRAALLMREKLLLRQIEAIILQTSKQNVDKSNVEFTVDLEEENELLAAIRCFGKFKLDNMNLQDLFLKNEDYILDHEDHETMYKCLANRELELENGEAGEETTEAIVVDFSQRNKNLIDHKSHHQSIINITLQEAKELIRKAKTRREVPPLNLEELDDELESSIAEAVSSLGEQSGHKSSQSCKDNSSKKSKSKKFKPKITINNCNGTINLRNISSLIINCANEDGVSAQVPLPSSEKVDKQKEEDEDDQSTQYLPFAKSSKHSESVSIASEATSTSSSATLVSAAEETSTTENSTASSNYSSNASSRSQSKKQKNKKSQPTPTHSRRQAPPLHDSDYEEEDYPDEEVTAATCDFYNRLLNEIKNSLKTKHGSNFDNAHYLKRTGNTTHTQQAAADSTCDANSNVSSSTASTITSSCSTAPPSGSQKGKRLILKNFENLKIILEANDEESLQPVQIEQWLAEIISETDQEPVQNTDILEHSKIHNESSS